MSNTTITPATPSELRQFGLLFSTVVILLFGVLLPWVFDQTYPLWPWVSAGVLAILAVLTPTTLRPFHRAWMRFGLIAGFINTRIIMFLLYYLVFVPIGALMTLIGRDALSRRTGDTAHDSYRVVSSTRDQDHFERPY